jgi:hypothetical protein
MFRQREKVVSRELNVVRTVEHSVKQGGWLNPIYDRLLIPPEYLVLVDRRGRFDHLAEFVEGMIKRLETHGVFITAYVFDGDPRLCFPLQGKDAPRSLNELAARYDNMRLIIFSEAQGLLSPVSGRLAPWSRLFNRWIHRSVLTPESPMNWGVTEHELQREFTVLPGTTDGLATFMRIIQGEEKVGEINAWADSAVPAILQERPQRWIERDAPPASQIDALLEELRVYLGEEGYAWFESCAVYPELQWQITITLGKLLKDKNGISLLDSKRMIDLARLPWFRYGIMPDWLRTRLVLDLEPDQEEEIRAVLEALLVTAVQGHGESLNLEVAYERRDWTSRFARPLLRLLQRVADTENPVRDHVFLDFMLQRFNLAVRVPETFRRQLFSRIGDQVGWKLLLQWIGVNLLPVITLTIVYLDPAGFFSTFTFMAGALQGLALGLAQWWFLRRFWRLNFWLWAGSIIFGVGLAIYINQLTGTSVSINYFGFWIMTVLGLIQSALLARWNVHFVQMWLFGSLLAGLINSIMSYFLPADINSAFLDFIGVMVASSIIYSLVSGWVFLYILRKRDSDSIRLVRSIWVVVNAVGFFLGFFLGALVAYVGGDINDMYVYLFLPIWMFVIAISQWFALRSFRFRRSGAWLICTFIAFVLGYLLSATENLNKYFYDYLYDLSIVSWIGLAIGTISGLFQALIWRRSGLKPFQMLVWFLSNSIGWLITLSGMVVLEAMSSISLSLDHFLAAAMLIGMAYGLITCWPLQPFLREAIRHQQASKESETYIDRKPWFLPLAIISKLRSRDPSARNSL